MTTVGFVGLGIMGGPMAANLVKAGFDVIGYNRSPEPSQRLVERGGRGADSLAEAVRDADVVVTMVPDSPDVEAVALGEDGIYALAKPGTLDATLSIMVGGDPNDFADARPVLEAVGKTVVHVGPVGSGQTVKAANQLIVAGTIELVAEAIVFLEAYGVDMEAAVTVLAGGLAGNAILERKAGGMLRRDFTPGFRIELHHKDMGIVTSAAREAGVVIPLGAVVAQLVASLKAQGDGGLDHSALLKLVEQLSGRD